MSLGPCDPATLRPDLTWLRRQLEGPDPPKMVRTAYYIMVSTLDGMPADCSASSISAPPAIDTTPAPQTVEPTTVLTHPQPALPFASHHQVVLVNPCNPSGVALSEGDIRAAAEMTAAAGAWLVLDNTYEQFMFDGRRHHCLGGPNIINVFSFRWF